MPLPRRPKILGSRLAEALSRRRPRPTLSMDPMKDADLILDLMARKKDAA